MTKHESRINVIGLGYIGLPTALILAANGWNIVGTDIDKDRISNLRAGRFNDTESGMQALFVAAMENGIIFETDNVSAEVYIVAVPTPFIEKNKCIDPTYVIKAVRQILCVCPRDAIIAIESTISPGTVDKYIRPLLGDRRDVHIAHVPERIIPGNIIKELYENSRTIGVDREEIGEKLKEIYQSFCKGKISITKIKTAEMTKVIENAYRDVNIAFANEMMKICESAGIDVYEAIQIANLHPRVNILSPGPGVGGHCISVDPWFLVGDYPGLANIILTARKINDSMPEFVLEKVYGLMRDHKVECLDEVGFYGLTYKENVDDIRESPTLQMIRSMKKHLAFGGRYYDPFVKQKIIDNQEFDFDSFIRKSRIIVVMVGHEQIIREQKKLRNVIVLDTRNVLHDIDTVLL